MLIPLSKDATIEMSKFGLATYRVSDDTFNRVDGIDMVRAVRRADGTSELVLYRQGQPVAGFCLAKTEAASLAQELLDLPAEVVTRPELYNYREFNKYETVSSRSHDLLPLFD